MCTKCGGMRSMRTSHPVLASSQPATRRAAGLRPLLAVVDHGDPGATIAKSPPSKAAAVTMSRSGIPASW